MKSLLKFIFNVLRNISLVLVILFFCLAFYLKQNPEEAEKIFAIAPQEVLYQQAEEEDADFVANQNFEIPEIGKSAKKLIIPIKGGNAYLRPSQVMCVDGDTLVTTSLQKILVKSTLNELHERFKKNGGDYFFSTKSAIINCHYVQQIVRESKLINNKYYYQDYVKLEDGRTISISNDKSAQLKSLLEQISI